MLTRQQKMQSLTDTIFIDYVKENNITQIKKHLARKEKISTDALKKALAIARTNNYQDMVTLLEVHIQEKVQYPTWELLGPPPPTTHNTKQLQMLSNITKNLLDQASYGTPLQLAHALQSVKKITTTPLVLKALYSCALLCACAHQNTPTVNFLLQRKETSVYVKNPRNLWTPLHYAAYHNNHVLCEILLDHGAGDVLHTPNIHRQTALDISRMGRPKILALFKDFQAKMAQRRALIRNFIGKEGQESAQLLSSFKHRKQPATHLPYIANTQNHNKIGAFALLTKILYS